VAEIPSVQENIILSIPCSGGHGARENLFGALLLEKVVLAGMWNVLL
jgi:hypothetical protein